MHQRLRPRGSLRPRLSYMAWPFPRNGRSAFRNRIFCCPSMQSWSQARAHLAFTSVALVERVQEVTIPEEGVQDHRHTCSRD